MTVCIYLQYVLLSLRPQVFFIVNSYTDGVAVILTILTMLSTPILTKIFGDGSLEVYREMPNTHYILFVNFIKRSQNCSLIVSNFKFNLNQGEDTEDWAHYDVAAEEEEVIERF